MKQIDSIDIFSAIGELPLDLIAFPRKTRSRDKLFKRLTAAACLLLCIGAIISLLVSPLFNVAKGDNMDFNNSPPPTNSGTGGILTDSSDKINYFEINVLYSGKIDNSCGFENNYLQISKNYSRLVFNYAINPSEDFNMKVFLSDGSGAEKELSPLLDSKAELAIYSVELKGTTRVEFKYTQSGRDFTIYISESEGLYSIEYQE